MKNQITLGYYSSILTNRDKDLTSKELDQMKADKELKQSMVVVGIFFAIIITFALLAEHGNTYI